MKRAVLGFSVAAALILTSCTPGIRGATASVTPLRSDRYEVVAKGVEKKLCNIRIFYLGEPPAVSKAVEQLIAEHKGDAAINVEYEHYLDEISIILQAFTGALVTNTCVKVKADIIRYL